MNQIRYIDPLKVLGKALLQVEKPNRYVGGEYGRLAKQEADLRLLIAFPDLYEIGMSNQALRILYNRLNQLEGVSCDRAFAPAPDFEQLLRSRGIPLYGLDTGISLGDLDLLLFTLGYELGITGVLAMLETAAIPLRALERTEAHPIVIMGGPCVSNPLPYALFVDAFWIGEAEGGFFSLIPELRALKMAGEGRAALLEWVRAHPSVWAPGKQRAKRAVDQAFALREPSPAVFPVPSMKVVQHHGAVEIMRGCPHGCRFCHAGYWYRPMRQKSAKTVRAEAAAFITQGGYREISLTSLSSGDYRYLADLVDALNAEHGEAQVSFQLPSLRVSTFSLPLLEKIAAVRKSGLTFAVETPVDAWQLAINKDVSRDTVLAIVQEARKRGWRGAKFYFMIGLPLESPKTPEDPPQHEAPEEVEIVNFILEIARRTGMHFTINVGTFVPKPHTPYQWAAQMDEATARQKLAYIRFTLKAQGHKVGIQDPFVSVLEGVISRGDERVGDLIEEAYKRGCRLDAWNEYIRQDIWQALFDEQAALIEEIRGRKPPDQPLPWQGIESGMSRNHLNREFCKAEAQEITSPCIEKCTNSCGICAKDIKIVENNIHDDTLHQDKMPVCAPDAPTWRILFAFKKQGTAVFHPHLALIEVFSMAMTRAGIPVRYSQGFNPLPKLEIASPVAIGITAEEEIAAIDTSIFFSAEHFKKALAPQLPGGITLGETMHVAIPRGGKKHSLASLLWGFSYKWPQNEEIDLVKAHDEKKYRLEGGALGDFWGLTRLSLWAKGLKDPNTPESYFKVYRELYPEANCEAFQ
ncbi:MAG: TIGR03936 family radical SAM-associated protein [Treponema sp.]|nr:TIGR03936 family radical SAM-associated protein [Treponema sp.]